MHQSDTSNSYFESVLADINMAIAQGERQTDIYIPAQCLPLFTSYLIRGHSKRTIGPDENKVVDVLLSACEENTGVQMSIDGRIALALMVDIEAGKTLIPH